MNTLDNVKCRTAIIGVNVEIAQFVTTNLGEFETDTLNAINHLLTVLEITQSNRAASLRDVLTDTVDVFREFVQAEKDSLVPLHRMALARTLNRIADHIKSTL